MDTAGYLNQRQVVVERNQRPYWAAMFRKLGATNAWRYIRVH